MMLEIILADENNKDIERIKVDSDLIVEAAIVVYNNEYYLYSGTDSKSFHTIKFVRVRPPVKVG